MAEKPSRGLADVVAASTALSDIDGRAGRLSYRGYDINELAGAAAFEEIAYLLQRGSAPSRSELDGYRAEIAAGRALGQLVTESLGAVARSQGPMEALRTLVSLASADRWVKYSATKVTTIEAIDGARNRPIQSPSGGMWPPPNTTRLAGLEIGSRNEAALAMKAQMNA